MSLKIESKTDLGTKSLKVIGVLDYSTVEQFEGSIGDLRGSDNLTIDFSGITFIDSTGIHALAQVITKCRTKEVLIRVKHIPKPIYEILDILGLVMAYGQEVFE